MNDSSIESVVGVWGGVGVLSSIFYSIATANFGGNVLYTRNTVIRYLALANNSPLRARTRSRCNTTIILGSEQTDPRTMSVGRKIQSVSAMVSEPIGHEGFVK